MSLAQEVELIRQVPILSNLEPSAQRMLCFASERVRYEAGQVLFRQGDAADCAYIVINGAVEVSLSTRDGLLPLEPVTRYGIIGETGMFADLQRTATVIAKTPVETLRVPRNVFQKVIHDSPDAAQRLTCLLARRLADITAGLSAPASCLAG